MSAKFKVLNVVMLIMSALNLYAVLHLYKEKKQAVRSVEELRKWNDELSRDYFDVCRDLEDLKCAVKRWPPFPFK